MSDPSQAIPADSTGTRQPDRQPSARPVTVRRSRQGYYCSSSTHSHRRSTSPTDNSDEYAPNEVPPNLRLRHVAMTRREYKYISVCRSPSSLKLPTSRLLSQRVQSPRSVRRPCAPLAISFSTDQSLVSIPRLHTVHRPLTPTTQPATNCLAPPVKSTARPHRSTPLCRDSSRSPRSDHHASLVPHSGRQVPIMCSPLPCLFTSMAELVCSAGGTSNGPGFDSLACHVCIQDSNF